MRIVLVILLLLLSRSGVSQQAETFYLLHYTPPPGWTVTQLENVRQFGNVQGNNYCIITAYASTFSAGSVNDDFRQEWESRVSAMASAMELIYPSTSVTTSGLRYVEGGANITLLNGGGTLYAHLVVLQVGNMRQSMLYGLSSKSMLAFYKKQLQEFLATISPVESSSSTTTVFGTKTESQTSTTAVVTSNKGTFYHGMEVVYVGASRGNNPRYLYLLPDNRFQWGYYQQGYYNYNWAQEQKISPGFCGTYTRTGDEIHLNFSDNPGYKPTFKVVGSGNLEGTYTFLKFPDITGLMLQGTYSIGDSGLNSWAGAKPNATFYPDGRFEDNALLCLGEMIDYSMPVDQTSQRMNENKIQGKGNYRIVDHSLILQYDDGRKRQLLIYLYEDDSGKPKRELLVVAGQSFVLIK